MKDDQGDSMMLRSPVKEIKNTESFSRKIFQGGQVELLTFKI